ncbi:MAG TPA: hypothetical protein ENN46_00960 [Candidatus Woesearchaeota archaeon]|nr:hypothetical protein [Candidatus Woesearchaeota archaeon]
MDENQNIEDKAAEIAIPENTGDRDLSPYKVAADIINLYARTLSISEISHERDDDSGLLKITSIIGVPKIEYLPDEALGRVIDFVVKTDTEGLVEKLNLPKGIENFRALGFDRDALNYRKELTQAIDYFDKAVDKYLVKAGKAKTGRAFASALIGEKGLLPVYSGLLEKVDEGVKKGYLEDNAGKENYGFEASAVMDPTGIIDSFLKVEIFPGSGKTLVDCIGDSCKAVTAINEYLIADEDKSNANKIKRLYRDAKKLRFQAEIISSRDNYAALGEKRGLSEIPREDLEGFVNDAYYNPRKS